MLCSTGTIYAYTFLAFGNGLNLKVLCFDGFSFSLTVLLYDQKKCSAPSYTKHIFSIDEKQMNALRFERVFL